jgi:hypothetical protein
MMLTMNVDKLKEALLWELPLIFAVSLLLLVHLSILALLFGIVDQELTELLIDLLPHFVL